MTIFENEGLAALTDSRIAVAVAKRTHELAFRLVEEGVISKHFLNREIYRWGQEETASDGISYREISSYSDGFGASLFIRGKEMLLLGSDHEIAPLDALDGDRDLYLTPLVKGLPEKWDFVVDMLQTEKRFQLNPPVSIFWFQNGAWHITDDYAAIKESPLGTRLGDHKDSVSYIPFGEFAAIFAHGGRTTVSDELIYDEYLSEWI